MLAMVGGLQGGTEDIKKKRGIKTFKIVKEDITGEMATVSFEIIYGNAETEKDNMKLKKEDGKWKINVSK